MFFTIIAVATVAYFFSEAVGFFIHRLAHWPKSGKLFRDHMHHHSVAYPPHSYLSDKYLGDIRTSFLPVFVPLFFGLNTLALFLFSWPIFLTFFLVSSTVSLVSNYFHDSFHLENHWLTRFKWHKKLRDMHRIHHSHVKKNLGIYVFFFDRLFKSFRSRGGVDGKSCLSERR